MKQNEIISYVIIGALTIGLLASTFMYWNADKELGKVPCWEKVCEEKENSNEDEFSNEVVSYKYKNEMVSFMKIEFNTPNFFPDSTIKGLLKPIVKEVKNRESFSEEIVYVKGEVLDSDGSVIVSVEEGELPEWFVEYSGE